MSLWNNTDSTASMPKYAGMGQIIKINYAGTGTSYVTGSFTIDAPPAGGVQATATYVAVGGTITSVTITNQGSGYVTAPAISTGAGTGLTLTSVIQAIDSNVMGVLIPKTFVFLDRTEAALAQNRAKGLKLPGWNSYREYVNAQGATRYKVECIIAMSKTAVAAGDAADDVVAADVAFTITTQPAATTTTTSGGATVAVVSAGSSFQWQVRAAAGGQYVSATGTINGITYTNGTTATLTLAGAVLANAGTKYRCQVLNAATTAAATSTVSTLAFGT